MLETTRRAMVLQLEELKKRFFSEARIAIRRGIVT